MATEISDERYEGRLSVVVKGRELIYQSTLYLVNSIDLSDNNLSGKLPEIRNLSRLGTLNLSINHFTGNIPEDIGGLSQLETLDLSRNQLSGPIPPSMISLTFLNHLNLSYNSLSGDDKATTDSSRAGNEDHDDEFEMRSWRRAYFRFLDEMKDRVMVVITVNVHVCKRNANGKEDNMDLNRW
ncbi:Leucine-rich repeat receptor-like protein FASCIATED EAR2 [Vitis vinifera]|uniref:Leucine-rich repeat receptor-like protein FASCIATED EAR2 n=1 Tax=Vitis vinifera TaxID=29760 RepID=A0A438CMB3_VITVI|nr:Leucine-rich repeat receptor-like protein FASCIATED EAR2 [Vitis vinifera]